jgi:hypothetical protein
VILDRYVGAKFFATLPVYGMHFIATDLAQPREQQCFAPVAAHLPDDDAHRALHDFLGKLGVVVDAGQRKPEQAREA